MTEPQVRPDPRTARPPAPAADTIVQGRGYERRFTQVPEELTLDLRVTALAHRLWCALDRQAGNRAVAIDSVPALAEKLGVSENSIRRARRCLVDADWMDEHPLAGRASRYVLHREQPSTTPSKNVRGHPDGVLPKTTGGAAKNDTRNARAVPSRRDRGEGSPPMPRFPGRCTAHGDVAVPPACGACADARRALASEPTPSPVAVSALLASVPSFDPDGANARGRAAARAAITRRSAS